MLIRTRGFSLFAEKLTSWCSALLQRLSPSIAATYPRRGSVFRFRLASSREDWDNSGGLASMPSSRGSARILRHPEGHTVAPTVESGLVGAR